MDAVQARPVLLCREFFKAFFDDLGQFLNHGWIAIRVFSLGHGFSGAEKWNTIYPQTVYAHLKRFYSFSEASEARRSKVGSRET